LDSAKFVTRPLRSAAFCIAAILDHAEGLRALTRDEVIEQAEKHLSQPFDAAFEAVFGQAPPDETNGDLRRTVVATNLDDSSERIVDLREFGVRRRQHSPTHARRSRRVSGCPRGGASTASF
jgi:hypothetical protein